jgi:hypothetical protein
MISSECGLHTLIHTFAFETQLQYLGLNSENAEFLAPLSFSQDLVPDFLGEKCELRDVIASSLPSLLHPSKQRQDCSCP